MAPKLLSLEETLDINSPITSSKAVFKINDGLRLILTQNEQKRSNLEMTYATDNFSFKYDIGKKNLKGKMHLKKGPVRLEMSQKVPNHKFYLMPSPALKASTTFLGGKDVLYAKWDMQKRQGKIGDELYFGEDKAYKAYCQITSNAQLQYGFQAKLDNKFLHSMALKVHSKDGVQYLLESHPSTKLKLKANYTVQKQMVKLEANYQPSFLKKSVAFALKYDVPVKQPENSSSGKVIIKWLF